MELKPELVEELIQWFVNQKEESEKEKTPAKKLTNTIFTLATWLAFAGVCITTVGYGISSYKDTNEFVNGAKGRIDNLGIQCQKLDKSITRIEGQVDVLIKTRAK